MAKELRSGYTTGTHATAVLGAVLREFYKNEITNLVEVKLEKSQNANIKVTKESPYHFSTIKVDNDDLDVTKGCCIYSKLYKESPKNLKSQTPSIIEIGKTKLFIYGGDGVGIVTKVGLKIQPNHPAINPTPLKMMREIASNIIDGNSQDSLHIVIGVVDGEEIAKQTANSKVGVIGGISILGTRGIVKPISADAYLDSIEAEIRFADASEFDYVVLTLGNTAQDYATLHYEKSQIVEIGNFIYDASKRLQNTNFKKMVFITSVAKMCKIAQECKNTHNRFGGIDFYEVKEWLRDELNIDLGAEEFLTLKAVLQKLTQEQTKLFTRFLGSKAKNSFKKWFVELGIKIDNVEILTFNSGDSKKVV